MIQNTSLTLFNGLCIIFTIHPGHVGMELGMTRRSLYISEDIKKGDIYTHENIRSIRPDYGLPPKYLQVVLGKKVNRNFKKGTPMKWNLLW